jgi:hypothetical protein
MPWTFAARTFAPAAPLPAQPVLAVADHGDGTGGTATVSGTEPSAAVSVQSLAVEEGSGATWIERGSRLGNGSVPLPAPPGYYWWRAMASTAAGQAMSNLVYQVFTDGGQAVLYRVLSAVKARVVGLALEGIEPRNVQLLQAPWEGALAAVPPSLPAVQIAPAEGATPLDQGTNQQDDVEYAIQVVLLDADPRRHPQERLPRLARWRQQVARAFRNQRLAGVPEVYRCTVDPHTLLDRSTWLREGLLVSVLTLRFLTRETRD